MRTILIFMRNGLFLISAALIAGCGENDTSQQATDTTEEGQEKAEPGQVVAMVNGYEVTIHELNAELSQLRIQEDTDVETLRRNALRAFITRKVLEQEASKLGIDRQPDTLMQIRRNRSLFLAREFVASQRSQIPVVSRIDAEEYVFDNSDIFAERLYYIFDSLVIPSGSLTEQQKDEIEEIADMDAIERHLQSLGIDSVRRPFTAYSEVLPVVMREQLPSLMRDRTVFFVVQGAQETIIRFQSSRPAAISGNNAIDAATRILQQRSAQEFLANLREQVIGSASIEFVGEFADMELNVDSETINNAIEGEGSEEEGAEEDGDSVSE